MTPPARDERRWTLGMSCATATMGTPNQAPPHRVNGRGHGTEGMSSMRAERTARNDRATFSTDRRGRVTASGECTAEQLHELFWKRVAVGTPDDCWPWLLSCRHGYGQVHGPLGALYGCRSNRVAWQVANGPIPDGLHVLHHCDNPPCCNPAHLFLGDHADNMRDGGAKGRIKPPTRRGAANHLARLTDRDVREIRVLLADGHLSPVAIGDRFDVEVTTIRNIAKGRTWAWLT